MQKEMEKREEIEKRLDYLYTIALDRFINKNDFIVADWLTQDEAEEYEDLLAGDRIV